MRSCTASVLFLVLFAAIQASAAAPGFDAKLASRVFAAAIGFTAPRVLVPVTPAELALWGLHGITALDPSLSTDQHGALVRLSAAERLLLIRAAPSPGRRRRLGPSGGGAQ
jgi:hypothetical protein